MKMKYYYLSVRMSDKMHERLKKMAAIDDRSKCGVVRYALDEYITRKEKERTGK